MPISFHRSGRRRSARKESASPNSTYLLRVMFQNILFARKRCSQTFCANCAIVAVRVQGRCKRSEKMPPIRHKPITSNIALRTKISTLERLLHLCNDPHKHHTLVCQFLQPMPRQQLLPLDNARLLQQWESTHVGHHMDHRAPTTHIPLRHMRCYTQSANVLAHKSTIVLPHLQASSLRHRQLHRQAAQCAL